MDGFFPAAFLPSIYWNCVVLYMDGKNAAGKKTVHLPEKSSRTENNKIHFGQEMNFDLLHENATLYQQGHLNNF